MKSSIAFDTLPAYSATRLVKACSHGPTKAGFAFLAPCSHFFVQLSGPLWQHQPYKDRSRKGGRRRTRSKSCLRRAVRWKRYLVHTIHTSTIKLALLNGMLMARFITGIAKLRPVHQTRCIYSFVPSNCRERPRKLRQEYKEFRQNCEIRNGSC